MNTKSKILTISVTKAGLSICSPARGEVLKMVFEQGLLQNMDIVDLPKLTVQVAGFVKQHELKPAEMIMVIDSDICFVQKFEHATDEAMSIQIQKFIDCVPISHPSYKLFQIKNEYHLVVINRRLYESIRQAFSECGFNVTAVVPEITLSPLGVASELDSASCRLLENQMEIIRQNSFISPIVKDASASWVNNNAKIAALFAILGVVVSLVGLGILVWQVKSTRQLALVKAKNRAERMTAIEIPIPSPTPTPIPDVTPDQLTMKVFNASKVTGTAGKLVKTLIGSDFAQTLAGDAPLSFSTNVVFSPKVTTEIKTNIIKIVSEMHTIPTVTVNSQTQFDIIITLGKIAP